MSDENMASDDDAAESDPASSSDVEITGAEPAKMAYDSDDEKYTCVVCKGKRNAGKAARVKPHESCCVQCPG